MKVLVVVARGLQAGAVGCYGNIWIDTPALDALGAAGIVFDQHFADTADAAGARRSWRTGRYHFPTAPDLPSPSTADDLLHYLRNRGIATRLILDTSRPVPPGFEEGWDAVDRVASQRDADALERTIDAAGAALDEWQGRDDWLLWLDLGTPLPPWDVPEEFQKPYFDEEPADEDEEEEAEDELEAEPEPLEPLTDFESGAIDPGDDDLYLRLHSSYASAVSYLDAGIGQLLEALSACEGGDEVAVLFTTDCGQALGEHGVAGSVRPWPHNEILHLPLILRLPGGEEAGRRVDALTQSVDVAATIADLFGLRLEAAHGHSLLPLARAQAKSVRPYACAGLEVDGAVGWVLRTPEWALLLTGPEAEGEAQSMQLYVKPDDRWEVNNVVQHHLEQAEQMAQTLRDFVTATQKPGPLTVPPLREVASEEAGSRGPG